MSPLPLSLALGVVLVVAAVLAALLRAIRAPGWAVLGGLLAGVLLGPTIAGRLQPEWYEHTMIGGVADREEVDRLRSRLEMDRLGAMALGGGEDDVTTISADVRADLADAQRRLDAARWEHAASGRWLTGLLAAGFFVLAAIARHPATGPRPDWFQPLAIGAWAAVVPGGIALLVLHKMEFDIRTCMAAAAALAIGGAVLPRPDLEAADRAEPGGRRLMLAAARVASVLAIGALAWAMLDRHGPHGLWFLLPLTALPVGWMLPARVSGVAGVVLDHLIVPALAAMISLRIELFEHFSAWPVILVLILTGDGRWLGAYVGAMVARPRRGLPTMGLALASMAAGRPQLVLTALALHTGVLNETLAIAMLLGSLLEEMTRSFRATIAARIAAEPDSPRS